MDFFSEMVPYAMGLRWLGKANLCESKPFCDLSNRTIAAAHWTRYQFKKKCNIGTFFENPPLISGFWSFFYTAPIAADRC
jgi:hypothetical protein